MVKKVRGFVRGFVRGCDIRGSKHKGRLIEVGTK